MFYPTACDLPLQWLYIVSVQGGEEIPHNRMPPSCILELPSCTFQEFKEVLERQVSLTLGAECREAPNSNFRVAREP